MISAISTTSILRDWRSLNEKGKVYHDKTGGGVNGAEKKQVFWNVSSSMGKVQRQIWQTGDSDYMSLDGSYESCVLGLLLPDRFCPARGKTESQTRLSKQELETSFSEKELVRDGIGGREE